jgi:hypothetical protein
MRNAYSGSWRQMTACECYLLRYPDGDPHGYVALRLGLIELLVRRALQLDGVALRRRGGLGERRVWLLAEGPLLSWVNEPALTAVLDMHEWVLARSPRTGHALGDPAVELTGILVRDLVRARRRDLGDDVAESLMRRGLFTGSGERTGAGENIDQQLDPWVRRAGTTFLDDVERGNLGRARSFLNGAGPAVLLAEQAYPALARLSREFATRRPAVPTRPPRDGWFDGSPTMLSGLEVIISVVDAALPLWSFRPIGPQA